VKKLATVSFVFLASTVAATQAQAQYSANPYGTNYGSSPYSANAYAANTQQQAKPRYDNWPNWYVGVAGGLNFMQTSTSGGVVSEMDDGWSGTVSLGFRPYVNGSVFDNVRLELAATYAAASSNINGLESSALSPMLNVYYDFRRGATVRPYIGAGLGMTRVEYEDDNQYFAGFLQEENPDYDADVDPESERTRNVLDEAGNPIPLSAQGDKDSDVAFSYQFMAGLSIAPQIMPHTEFSMGYRYQRSGDLDYSLDSMGSFTSEYEAHVLEAGARFRF
jgi:opacity protein-like surface antigen